MLACYPKTCSHDKRACYKLGTIRNITPTSIATATMSVAAGTKDFFVAWRNDKDIHGAVVQPDGTPGKPFLIYGTGTSPYDTPIVASHGPGYLAAWNGAGGATYSAAFTPPSSLQYPAVKYTSVTSATALAHDGTRYLLLSGPNTTSLVGRFVSNTGAVGPTVNVPLAPAKHSTSIGLASDGTRYLAVWRSWYTPEAHGQFLDKTGKLLGKVFTVASGGTKGLTDRPKVAYGGGRYLVVWQDSRNAGLDIIGALVEGTPGLGAKQVAHKTIKVAATTVTEQSPAVAYASGRFFVAWHGTGVGVRGAQVKVVASGGKGTAVVGPQISLTSTKGKEAEVAFDGAGLLLVWREKHHSIYSYIRTRVITFGK